MLSLELCGNVPSLALLPGWAVEIKDSLIATLSGSSCMKSLEGKEKEPNLYPSNTQSGNVVGVPVTNKRALQLLTNNIVSEMIPAPGS